MGETDPIPLIHAGTYTLPRQGAQTLLLRKMAPRRFAWFRLAGEKELEAGIEAPSAEEALRLAHQKWKGYAFRTLICGFRYTLPERDEHGMNALFHQMVASYRSPTGVYFDEELGHNCHVQNASKEALDLWHRLEG